MRGLACLAAALLPSRARCPPLPSPQCGWGDAAVDRWRAMPTAERGLGRFALCDGFKLLLAQVQPIPHRSQQLTRSQRARLPFTRRLARVPATRAVPRAFRYMLL